MPATAVVAGAAGAGQPVPLHCPPGSAELAAAVAAAVIAEHEAESAESV